MRNTGLRTLPVCVFLLLVFATELNQNPIDRALAQNVVRRPGSDNAESAEAVRKEVLGSPVGQAFRGMLFQRVVPNLKRLDLLTPRVRDAFEKLDILKFEDSDPEEQDRRLGFS